MIISLALTAIARADEPKLKVGDSAPKLQVGEWVQGEPVTNFEKDKVYLVEFWATWCGPCRVSIPHLNELHQKYQDKGLIVIGQDVFERDEKLVAPFVKQMGEKMTYRVALDDKSGNNKGAMAVNWMEAAGQSGIPTAFLVNKEGKIAWIGHPMTLKESLIEEVLAGRHDLKTAAAAYQTEQANKVKTLELSRELMTKMRERDWAKAEAALVKIEELLPEDSRDRYSMVRFQILMGRQDYDAAYKLADEYSTANRDNAMLQNQIAWYIATAEGLEKRDLPLAEKIAERANLAAKGKDANILDTLARVQFMNGKKKEAIETQQKAVDLASGDMKDKFEEFLASYKAGKLPPVSD